MKNKVGRIMLISGMISNGTIKTHKIIIFCFQVFITIVLPFSPLVGLVSLYSFKV